MPRTAEREKNCLRIHVRDDFDFSEPLSAARLARKAMSLETRYDRLKMITLLSRMSFVSNGDAFLHCLLRIFIVTSDQLIIISSFLLTMMKIILVHILYKKTCIFSKYTYNTPSKKFKNIFLSI